MIRIDAVWLAIALMDMRSGPEKAFARVVTVFDAAQPHCVHLFANRLGSRMKVLMHDGLCVWLAARCLHQGKFSWPSNPSTA
ncbi:IS66 family insertion sequence element accessory protein TnpB [Pseudomonas frederiksbergensis]|uniref:IS66 family insertion sequence element accessory protein TnpB n=1 Tax=Pseudomonas frederiksbergensis TaxID=104087 RepID=UPI001364C7F1|nr:IS66 family insertion sequence element accessory protein TnpB [Pseudomonas frederiksbergensis]